MRMKMQLRQLRNKEEIIREKIEGIVIHETFVFGTETISIRTELSEQAPEGRDGSLIESLHTQLIRSIVH